MYICMYICTLYYMSIHIYIYNPNAYFYCVILCNACILIIILTNDSIFRDMRCQNKFDLLM